jgi:hypothetical protein
MTQQPLTLDSLFDALAEGWRVANETRGTSIAYTAIFVLAGAAIIGGLLARAGRPSSLPPPVPSCWSGRFWPATSASPGLAKREAVGFSAVAAGLAAPAGRCGRWPAACCS